MKLFILHGWTYNLDTWSEISKELKQLGYEPILLNVPGLTTASNKAWTINDYIDWLDGELKDQDKPIVIGHSNGGRIALAYAQKYPNKFKQLILIDSAGLAHETLLRKTKLGILYVLSKLAKPVSGIKSFRRAFYKVIGARDYYEASPNMRQTMRYMLSADKTLDFSKITVPTTVIWGQNDRITPLKDGQQIAKLLPNAKLRIINDARHAPHATNASQVANIINQAIKV